MSAATFAAVSFGKVMRRVLAAVPPSMSLLVKTSVPVKLASVTDPVGNVTVPLFVKDVAVAPDRVLFEFAKFLLVSVSDNAKVDNVLVDVGSVTVAPLFVNDAAVAPVNVFVELAKFLLVSVCDWFRFTSVYQVEDE